MMKRRFGFSRGSIRAAFAVGVRPCSLSMYKQRLSPELERSPYGENEKHVINGEIIDVTYHIPDWWKNFHPNISDRTMAL